MIRRRAASGPTLEPNRQPSAVTPCRLVKRNSAGRWFGPESGSARSRVALTSRDSLVVAPVDRGSLCLARAARPNEAPP